MAAGFGQVIEACELGYEGTYYLKTLMNKYLLVVAWSILVYLTQNRRIENVSQELHITVSIALFYFCMVCLACK